MFHCLNFGRHHAPELPAPFARGAAVSNESMDSGFQGFRLEVEVAGEVCFPQPGNFSSNFAILAQISVVLASKVAGI